MQKIALPVNVARAALPEAYKQAKNSLAECERVDECKSWADKAAALASYAKQARDDALLDHARKIQARAVKRAGELLKLIEPQQGGDRKSKDRQRPVDRKQAASDAGMSPRQAKQAIRVSNVPDDEFEREVEHGKKTPTVTELARRGTQKRKQAERETQDRIVVEFMLRADGARRLAKFGYKGKTVSQAQIKAVQAVIDAWTSLLGKLQQKV